MIRNAKAPDDIAAAQQLGVLVADGEWVRFHTLHAYAHVFVAGDRTTARGPDLVPRLPGYLLHWIESRLPGAGHGTAVLTAVGAFGDRLGAAGHLVCDARLVGWYERLGWQVLGEFEGDVVMGRFYSPGSSTVTPKNSAGDSPRR